MLAESVAQRMREGRARARTVSVGARAADDLCTRSRQCKLPVATDVTLEVARAAWGLLRELEPVSYTHLDVYKRQTYTRESSSVIRR